MDSLSGFNVFVQVADTRSFVSAGRQLGLSASAVGKNVARLEEKLGVRLFHRSTRSITLTAEGALFLDRCRRILAEVEAAQLELSHASGKPSGRLRISLPLVSSLMLPVLGDFMRQYPDIALDLDFTEQLGLRLGNGKYCTLRLFFVLTDINWPQRSILPFCQFFIVSPDIVSRQIYVFPAQRRQV